MTTQAASIVSDYKYGFHDDEAAFFKAKPGLRREGVAQISEMKGEPAWMRDFRLHAYDIFLAKEMPKWAEAGQLAGIDFDSIHYYVRASDRNSRDWDDVPEYIKNTFDKLGIPEAEKKFLAGVGAQYDSEVVYHNIREDLAKQGVIFVDMDTGLREHEDIVREYFGTIIPPNDNKFAALNSAVWSGGSFVFVPRGVKVEIPLQAYFRINTESMGQFERTLIIAEPGSYVHYVEGCTAPIYTTDSLHSAVVELIALEGARIRYTTIQNWSNNVYNLVTKRAAAYKNAVVEWVDGNLGCLAEGSTVTTPRGLTPIEDVQVGDEVLSYDETAGQLCFRRVMAKRFSGHQPVRTVSIGQRRLQATSNHPFFSYRYQPERPRQLRRYELGYVRLDELTEAIVPRSSLDYGQPYRLKQPELVTVFANSNQYGGGYTASRELASRLNAPEYSTDELMWLFGYWLGDGDMEVRMGKTAGVVRFAKVGFSTPTGDRARSRVVGAVTALLDAPPTERGDGVHLAWNSKELAGFFEANGFTGKAATKRVPAWVWSIPESQRVAFIAGYLDADGHVSASQRRFSVKSCNRGLLEDISSLLVTLGITARLHTEFDAPREVSVMGVTCVAKGSHRLDFPLDTRFLAHVSPSMRAQAAQCAPARLVHKRSVGRSTIRLAESVEIDRVEVSEPSVVAVPTWDIEVEGTGNFVSQGFIVHNSKLTMKYPSVYLMEPGAHGEILSLAFAGPGQHQDAGGKVIHGAPNTTSTIISKSVSKGGGRTSYRGTVKVYPGCNDSVSNVRCDALMIDEDSRSDTYPTMEIDANNVTIGHEATVGKLGEDQLFYLMSRGLPEVDAAKMIVNGFVEPIVKELPMEYAVELNRLIELQMEGSVG